MMIKFVRKKKESAPTESDREDIEEKAEHELKAKEESKWEKGVTLLSHVCTFLCTVRSITTELKLNSAKIGPMNRKIMTAFEDLNLSNSRNYDVIQSLRHLSNDLLNRPSEDEQEMPRVSRGQRKQKQEEVELPVEVKYLQDKVTKLAERLKTTEHQLKKKQEYATWLTQKNQELAAKIPAGSNVDSALDDSDDISRVLYTHVANDYEFLLENQWREALNELQSLAGVTRLEAYKILSLILMTSQDICEEIHSQVLADYTPSILKISNPFPPANQSNKKKKPQDSQTTDVTISPEAKGLFENTLRNQSNDVNLDYLEQEIKTRAFPKAKEISSSKALQNMMKQDTYGPALDTFLQNAARITWKMTVQVPKLKLRAYTTSIGSNLNENIMEPIEDSMDPKQYPVLFYVHPALVQQQSPDKLLVKAKVMCGEVKR